MKKKIVAPGIYMWENGRFSYRPWVRGRRTERTLKATTLRAALREYKESSEESPAPSVEELCKLYLEANAPDKRGNPRPEKFVALEKKRIENFLPFFAKAKADEIRIKWCVDYKVWRCARLNHSGTGERTVDMELNTLSNVLNYAVLTEEIEFNRIRTGRPRFRAKKFIRHCRECCPRSGDELHKLANYMFFRYRGRSESLAWQMMFEALSGCRTCETVPLRWDAEPGQPGYIREGKWLYIARAKMRDGESADCIEMQPELQMLIEAMRRWREADERYSKMPWFFPSHRKDLHITNKALHHALFLVAPKVFGPGRPITSHGMRAFFVTWQRVRGVPDSQIAEMIGHRSGGSNLIWNVYGRKLPAWATADFNPIPKNVEPIWAPFLKGGGSSVVEALRGEK